MKRMFLSTSIPYVNSVPHIGFALEIIQADVITRFNRKLGKEVYFLTGTDENSLKNVEAAKKEGIGTAELVEKNSLKFKGLKEILNISFNDFIRTTEERHLKGAQKLWNLCRHDLYKKTYEGLYCVGCEQFYKEEELVNGLCPEHKTKPEFVKEENYFFKLSKYENELKRLIEKDKLKIVPETRKNETLSFISSGLNDICVSRSAKRGDGWGISVPHDPSEVMWVWFDALSNYINALGFGEGSKSFKEFWEKNNDKLHIVGKGVARFHTVYWPAMLLSAKIPLPNKVFVHGYITVNGEKMSKSQGNVVDPYEVVEKYGTDASRYFFLREIPPFEDGDFTYLRFEERYNGDLANGLGNLVSRVVKLSKDVKSSKKIDKAVKKEAELAEKNTNKSLEEFRFNEALQNVFKLVSFSNEYIDKAKPWINLHDNKSIVAVDSLIFAILKIADMLEVFLPETAEKIRKQVELKEVTSLFPRLK